MHIKMEKIGCYQATVSYGDVSLKNGDFNILVLSRKFMYMDTKYEIKNVFFALKN